MDYNYRSPLQDDYYGDDSQTSKCSRPLPHSRPQSRSQHRGVKPYSRPSSSNGGQAATYSSRYKLTCYPKELNDKFGALECKLCAVQVTSPVVAKMHYSGKQHMKKVKNFLAEWSMKTGNPMLQLDLQSSVSTLPDYCELCDVRLTSSNCKMLHYSGKHHRKNERDPVNAKKKSKVYDTIDLSGTDVRFGIGEGFSSDQKSDTKPNIEGIKLKDFICELCNVKAVTQEQLNIHIRGKNHQHKLRKKELRDKGSDRLFKCDICNVSLETPQLFRKHLEGKPHAKMMKKHEAGEAFCEICNIDFTSLENYQMHISGKKHEKKAREIALRTTVMSDQKQTPAISCGNCSYVGNLDSHVCDKSQMNTTPKMGEYGNTWKCAPCHMVFTNHEEYEEHKKTKRHLLCMLVIEGDRISEDKKHWYCFTCRKQYNDQKEYCDHLFEQKHMTLTDESFDLGSKTDLFYCTVCAIIMIQEVKDAHMRSKNHLLQAARQDITRTLTTLANQDLGTHMFHCTHCDTNFLNFVAYSDHVLSLDHLEEIVCAKTEI